MDGHEPKTDDTLRILIDEVIHDTSHDLGVDPGLQKDGVEKHLQELLAEHPGSLAAGLTLVRREFPTAIGPVDLMCRDVDGGSVAVEIKRRGEIDGVEQLTRYLELLNRDPLLKPVRGIFAAQEIKPQARVLASDRGIACAVVDYDALRGMDDPSTGCSDVRIFHIATATDWAAAQASGSYTTSTRGVSLADEGFIHASREDQWEGVRDRYYADVDEPLVLLTIDTDLLDVPVVEEDVPGARRSRTCTARSGRRRRPGDGPWRSSSGKSRYRLGFP